MGSLAYIALVLALAVGIYLLIRYQRERQKELYRMEALRDSRLYKDIYPLILRAAARDLDQVRIERDRIIAVKPGDALQVEGIPVEVVPSYNTNKKFHPQANEWVGYVVTVDGTRCYVAGDTDINPDVLQVKCDIAMVPVGGTYTTTAEEAAQLVNRIRPAIAVPTHFGAVTGTKEDGKTFARFVDPEIQVMQKLTY